MAMKRILRMSVVTTVIACGVLYGQRALVSAAPAGEAAAGPAVIADAEKPNRPKKLTFQTASSTAENIQALVDISLGTASGTTRRISGGGNDDCTTPQTIGDGSTAYSTVGNTTDGLPHLACQFDGQTYHDDWFVYTATCTGELTASTCDAADYDTDLVVYDGCVGDWPCPPGDAQMLGCNDDGEGCGGLTSLVTVGVVAGNCYTVRVGGWNDGDMGTGNLTITCETIGVCGDGVCGPDEDCASCPEDCGACPICGTCPWDTFPVDGVVGAGDLAFLLGNWGPIPPDADPAVVCLDAEPDGTIGAFDLALLLGNWGQCPDQKTGACCLLSVEKCEDLTEAVCEALGGIFQGIETFCESFLCLFDCELLTFDAPKNPSGCVVTNIAPGFRNIQEQFQMEATFGGLCFCCEYRQRVRGVFTLKDVLIRHPLGPGVVMKAATLQEDGARKPPGFGGPWNGRYGHRADPQNGILLAGASDQYVNPFNRPIGCKYEGIDAPGFQRVRVGDDYSFDLHFEGRILDVCNGTIVQTKTWTVSCAGTAFDGDPPVLENEVICDGNAAGGHDLVLTVSDYSDETLAVIVSLDSTNWPDPIEADQVDVAVNGLTNISFPASGPLVETHCIGASAHAIYKYEYPSGSPVELTIGITVAGEVLEILVDLDQHTCGDP